MCDIYDVKFSELITIIERLRKECLWDREQTNQTIKNDLIEEAYELYEALQEDDNNKIIEELGDVLLQVLFHSVIKSETNQFTIADVIDRLVDKLIKRHPHVFNKDSKKIQNASEVLSQWDSIKQQDKKSLLEGIPKRMPALQRAFKVQKRLSKVGLDFENVDNIFEKILEELNEFKSALDVKQRSIELGDILFSVVNLSRFFDIDPEEALHLSIDKIVKKLDFIESKLHSNFDEASKDLLNLLWEQAKTIQE